MVSRENLPIGAPKLAALTPPLAPGLPGTSSFQHRKLLRNNGLAVPSREGNLHSPVRTRTTILLAVL